MKIKYFAYLRDCTHLSEEEYQGSAPTLRVLIEDLCRRYGAGFRKWLLTPDGEMSSIAIILVNGNDVRHTGWLETPLAADDVVFIFPPVAGGAV